MRLSRFCVAFAAVHLVLVFCVSVRDAFASLAQGATILPHAGETFSRQAQNLFDSALGQHLPKWNPLRETVATYLNLAGIEAGYGFFAPHVPGSYRLVFELHFGDGHVEYDFPHVHSRAGELRLTSLLDLVGNFDNHVVREGIIELLTKAAWREHSDLTLVRAIFGIVDFPTSARYQRGEGESYRALYSYDFTERPDHLNPALK